MREQALTIIAITSIILGLTALFFFLPEQSEDPTLVTIKGRVEKIDEKETITLIKIKPATPLTIVTFEKTDFVEGDMIQALGKLQAYHGHVEFIATSITKKEK